MTDLFQYAAQLQNWRRSDPPTSKAAGLSVTKFSSEHHAAILRALREADHPLSAEEVSDRVGTIDKVQACKRFSELERAGLIEKTVLQYTNRSGRRAFRYRIRRQPDEVAGPTPAQLG
jgi:response regulator of citrate/malate metabolism